METDLLVLKKITTNPQPKCESCEDVSMTSSVYCFNCSIFYCQNCWHRHHGTLPEKLHNSINLDIALAQIKEKQEKPQTTHVNEESINAVEVTSQEAMKWSPILMSACNGFVTEREKLQQVLSWGQEVKKSIQQQKKKVDTDITAAFARLRQTLDKRQSVLLSESCHTAISKETHLVMQLEGLQQLETAMSECHNMAENAKTQEDWDQVQTRAEHLLAQFSDTSLELCENAVIPVEVETDKVSADIESFGYVANGACPNKSIKSHPSAFAVVDKEVNSSIHTQNASDQEIGHGGEVVRGLLTRKREARSKVMAATCGGRDNTDHFLVKPKVISKHSLSVSRQCMESNPFALHATRDYAAALKEPMQKITDQVQCPRCVAFAGNSDMFLVCHCGESVRVFDSNGEYKSRIGKQGSGDLEFVNPYGIAISDDTVYVVDSGNHRIQIFTTGSKFLGHYGSRGSGNYQFAYPMGVCVGDNGMVYVSDHGNHRIQAFCADGMFSHSINGNHFGEGAFRSPQCLALGPNGDLHVTGYASNNVTVFTPKGKFVRSYEVATPKGIAIDKAGFSLVSSYDILSIFDPLGKLLKEIKGIGSAEAIAISPDGFVLISNHNNQLLKY